MMRRALFHAERALGATAPNPLVGAVVVDADGVVVGQGHHARAGEAHAEVVALDAAGERARGGTLYATLEPCCHTGRTGPCTDRILSAGIARVVAATIDPFPAVAGRGVALLREAGLDVVVGVEEAAARRMNAAYHCVHDRGRPLVVVKAATSRDSRIAARPGRPTAISGAAAARRTQRLRAEADAIAVGVGTALADDPRLTVRDVVRVRPLTRVVFDRRLRTPPTARLFARADGGEVIMFADPDVVRDDAARVAGVTAAGGRVMGAASLGEAARLLAGLGVHTLLVEGGAILHRAFWDAGLVDRLRLIVAPRTLGDGGVPLFDGMRIPWTRLSAVSARACGDDMWMEADVHWDR
ncbi:MAG: bifunctional diaminohydroxyphosphoribosylaminopyrimidine deaminase/5-amino-6-(5-phosphoribosylamino)uracil reductase RibD [Vicinamibacterales bacterium]